MSVGQVVVVSLAACCVLVPLARWLLERRRNKRLAREADALMAERAARDVREKREALDRENRAAAIAAAFRLPELLYYRDCLPAAPGCVRFVQYGPPEESRQ